MRIVIHAPTAGALRRARSNARNLLKAEPGAEVRIVANGGGVAAALEAREAETDGLLVLCENTLAATGQSRPEDLATTPAAVVTLARLQAEGWTYIRA